VDVEWILGADPVPPMGDYLRSHVAALGWTDDDHLRELALQMLIDASDQVFGVSAQEAGVFESPAGSGISLVQTGPSSWRILAGRR
jgi:hypothetical protein